MSKSETDRMLALWFEENVMHNLGEKERRIFGPSDFVASFRDYFSVRLREVLPPHPISEKLQKIAGEKERHGSCNAPECDLCKNDKLPEIGKFYRVWWEEPASTVERVGRCVKIDDGHYYFQWFEEQSIYRFQLYQMEYQEVELKHVPREAHKLTNPPKRTNFSHTIAAARVQYPWLKFVQDEQIEDMLRRANGGHSICCKNGNLPYPHNSYGKCIADNDGDGNCAWHPHGCPEQDDEAVMNGATPWADPSHDVMADFRDSEKFHQSTYDLPIAGEKISSGDLVGIDVEDGTVVRFHGLSTDKAIIDEPDQQWVVNAKEIYSHVVVGSPDPEIQAWLDEWKKNKQEELNVPGTVIDTDKLAADLKRDITEFLNNRTVNTREVPNGSGYDEVPVTGEEKK